SLLELLVISRVVAERKPARVFELGTFDGRTTLALADNAPEHAIVYTLDLPSGAPTAFKLEPNDRRYVEKTSSGTVLSGNASAAALSAVRRLATWRSRGR